MSKTIRRVGLSLVIVAYIVVVVFFLIRDHKKGISNALSDSLDFIGGKLNAMVVESPDKIAATEAYENFKRQVLEQKIPPQQVESVAANILNLSNSGVVISPSEAEEMLQSSFTVHIEDDSIFADTLAIKFEEISSPEMAFYSNPKKPVTPDDLEKLISRLSSIYAFEMKMGHLMKEMKKSDNDFRRHMYYDSKNGLKLVVDPKSKEKIIKGKIAEIDIELKNLENEELLIYNNDLTKELHREKQKLEKELQYIISIRQNRNIEPTQKAHELKRLETFKKLRLMGLAPLNTDSLHKFIEKIERETSRKNSSQKQ